MGGTFAGRGRSDKGTREPRTGFTLKSGAGLPKSPARGVESTLLPACSPAPHPTGSRAAEALTTSQRQREVEVGMLTKLYHQSRGAAETVGQKPDSVRTIATEVCALGAFLVSVLGCVCACSAKAQQRPPELGD